MFTILKPLQTYAKFLPKGLEHYDWLVLYFSSGQSGQPEEGMAGQVKLSLFLANQSCTYKIQMRYLRQG